jgi:hypothetical protein
MAGSRVFLAVAILACVAPACSDEDQAAPEADAAPPRGRANQHGAGQGGAPATATTSMSAPDAQPPALGQLLIDVVLTGTRGTVHAWQGRCPCSRPARWPVTDLCGVQADVAEACECAAGCELALTLDRDGRAIDAGRITLGRPELPIVEFDLGPEGGGTLTIEGCGIQEQVVLLAGALPTPRLVEARLDREGNLDVTWESAFAEQGALLEVHTAELRQWCASSSAGRASASRVYDPARGFLVAPTVTVFGARDVRDRGTGVLRIWTGVKLTANRFTHTP